MIYVKNVDYSALFLPYLWTSYQLTVLFIIIRLNPQKYTNLKPGANLKTGQIAEGNIFPVSWKYFMY
jgi:hypothetical protein